MVTCKLSIKQASCSGEKGRTGQSGTKLVFQVTCEKKNLPWLQSWFSCFLFVGMCGANL